MFQQVLQSEGMPTQADHIIAAGIGATLQEISKKHLHKTCIGRVANNTLLRSAVSKVQEMQQRGRHDPQAMSVVLNRSESALRKAQQRMSDQAIFDLMDPTREQRSNALSATDLEFIQAAWEMYTEPAPDYVVHHKIGHGEYITKAVHWKKKSGEEIFEQVTYQCM